MTDHYNNGELEYLASLPPLPAGRREWQDGDIDWSCCEEFLKSLWAVHDKCSSPHQEMLRAAIDRFMAVVPGIHDLDPRYTPEWKWGDTVELRDRAYTLDKAIYDPAEPIGPTLAQLSDGKSIVNVSWSDIPTAPWRGIPGASASAP